MVHVSLELDQSTGMSHTIWSARRCGPLRRLIELAQDISSRGYFPLLFAQIRFFGVVFGLGLTDDLAGM